MTGLDSDPHPKGEAWGKHVPGLGDAVGPFGGGGGGGYGGGGARGGCLPLILACVGLVGWLV